MAKAGIYCIRNKTNGKCYIGKSVDIPKRWEKHKTSLRKGCHHNKYLQKAWDAYGEESFCFEVLEYADPNKLASLEIAYISRYKAFGKNGYNLTMGGDGGMLGAIKTQESKKKVSESLKGRTLTNEHKRKIGNANKVNHVKPVLCVETGQIFRSLKEAGKYFNTDCSNIGHACNGRQEKAKGFHFTYI